MHRKQAIILASGILLVLCAAVPSLAQQKRAIVAEFTSIRAYRFGVKLRGFLHRVKSLLLAPARALSAARRRLRGGRG